MITLFLHCLQRKQVLYFLQSCTNPNSRFTRGEKLRKCHWIFTKFVTGNLGMYWNFVLWVLSWWPWSCAPKLVSKNVWISVKCRHQKFLINTLAKKLQTCRKQLFWSTSCELDLLFSWNVEFCRGECFSVMVNFQFIFHAVYYWWKDFIPSIGSPR